MCQSNPGENQTANAAEVNAGSVMPASTKVTNLQRPLNYLKVKQCIVARWTQADVYNLNEYMPAVAAELELAHTEGYNLSLQAS